MKKNIILTIAITFIIFQMVVLATAIDIGVSIDSVWGYKTTSTIVNISNPADEDGTITDVEIWAANGYNLAGCEVATFYVVSGNNLSTRDTEYIGDVTGGSKQNFAVNLTVQTGDYLGIYFTSGGLNDWLLGYGGYWFDDSHDQIPCTNVTFDNSNSAEGFSIYGTGATEEVGATFNYYGHFNHD